MSELKSCLIVFLTVFSWTFNSLACFLTDVVSFFIIAQVRTAEKTPFRFFLWGGFNPPFPLFLKKLFFCKKNNIFALYTVDKIFGLVSVLSKWCILCHFFSCSLILGWSLMEQSSRIIELIMNIYIAHLLFFKNWTNQTKNRFRNIPCFPSVPYRYECLKSYASVKYIIVIFLFTFLLLNERSPNKIIIMQVFFQRTQKLKLFSKTEANSERDFNIFPRHSPRYYKNTSGQFFIFIL